MQNQVEETIEIDAAPEAVWAALADFHDMSWLPLVARTDGDGGNTPNAARRLTLKNDANVDEVLTAYDPDGMSYSYRIAAVDVTVLPVTDYASTIGVSASAAGRSRVTWRGTFGRGAPHDDPPPSLNDDAAKQAVSGLYRTGLDGLKAKVASG
jgi:hypothetical protein